LNAPEAKSRLYTNRGSKNGVAKSAYAFDEGGEQIEHTNSTYSYTKPCQIKQKGCRNGQKEPLVTLIRTKDLGMTSLTITVPRSAN
jgi:hypothetical protein